MSKRRTACLLMLIAAALELAVACALQGQATGGDSHHPLFACLEDGLTREGSTGFGCQLLAKYELTTVRDVPLFWHIARLSRGAPAVSAPGERAFAVSAADDVWVFRFDVRSAVPTQGQLVIKVGPLPLTPGKPYEVIAYFVVMPVGAHTIVHTHPGPEAWYLLEGAQCLEMPSKAMKLSAGEGGIAPANTPMRLTNSGSTTRRALFIVIHDPTLPWSSPSDWVPAGRCER
jgi:quercetin dioxygenase-like cupin family protein